MVVNAMALPMVDQALPGRMVTVPSWLALAAGGVVLVVVAVLLIRSALLRRRCDRLEQLEQERARELETAQKLIAEQKTQLADLARTDPLTGLATRRILAEEMPGRIGLARRAATVDWPDHFCPRNGMALFKIDLDHFQEIQSGYGAKVGDALLGAVAEALRQMVRTEDLLARWSDHELLLVASGVSHEGVAPLAEKLQRTVASASVLSESGRTIAATASIGFCPYPLIKRDNVTPENWNQLVDLVEKYLARARSRGGSRACGLNWSPTFSPEHGEVEVVTRLLANPELKIEGLELLEIPFKP